MFDDCYTNFMMSEAKWSFFLSLTLWIEFESHYFYSIFWLITFFGCILSVLYCTNHWLWNCDCNEMQMDNCGGGWRVLDYGAFFQSDFRIYIHVLFFILLVGTTVGMPMFSVSEILWHLLYGTRSGLYLIFEDLRTWQYCMWAFVDFPLSMIPCVSWDHQLLVMHMLGS